MQKCHSSLPERLSSNGLKHGCLKKSPYASQYHQSGEQLLMRVLASTGKFTWEYLSNESHRFWLKAFRMMTNPSFLNNKT